MIEPIGRSPDADGNRTYDLKQRNRNGHYPCLVIDDQQILIDVVARMLSKLGHQVDTADNKADVISLLAGNHYDLIVTDLKMPDMNGYQLAVDIKKKNQAVRVVIMTGCSQHDCTEMMDSRIADGWIFKTFGLNKLRCELGEL